LALIQLGNNILEEKMKTILVFIRHLFHEKQIVSNSEKARERKIGKALAAKGIKFDVVYSSPQGRCLTTIIELQTGMGKILPMRTSDALGDAVLGEFPFSKEYIAELKTEAKEKKVGAEGLLLSRTDPETVEKIKARGQEGADFIREKMAEFPGKTIGISSHGASRLETVISDLTETPLDQIQIMDRGAIYVIEFEDGKCTGMDYLGCLGHDTEKTQ